MSLKESVLTGVTRQIATIHTGLLRRSKGRFGNRFRGADVLLLTVRGRRSGKEFTVPLLHIRDGADFVVAASNGGMSRHPQWWLNLQADPTARVDVRGEHFDVRASEVTGEGRRELWEALNAAFAGYDKYQQGLDRQIPVVRLIKLAEDGATETR